MTDTKLNQLIINKLTQAQYETALSSGEIDSNQLYFTTDESINDALVVEISGEWVSNDSATSPTDVFATAAMITSHTANDIYNAIEIGQKVVFYLNGMLITTTGYEFNWEWNDFEVPDTRETVTIIQDLPFFNPLKFYMALTINDDNTCDGQVLAHLILPVPSEEDYNKVPMFTTNGFVWTDISAEGDTTLMKGPYLVTESCTLDLTTLGLAVGDLVNVVCVGGGGGCGYGGGSMGYGYGYGAGQNGGPHSPSYFSAAAGGSGYSSRATIVLTSTSVDITIGAAGAAATSSSGAGTTGGTTSFGSYLSAAGGGGGTGGSGSSSNTSTNSGGIGAIDGEYRGNATYAHGGAGIVNDGTFSTRAGVAGDPQCGTGAVFIWW